MDFAQAIYDELPRKTNPYASNQPHLNAEQTAWLRQQPHTPVAYCVVPYHGVQVFSNGSTDVGDVSWAVPTAQIRASTWAASTPAHSWQATTQGKSPLAHKFTLFAAKTLAGAAIDLICDPEAVAQAKAEHDELLGHKPFVSPIPKDVMPPIPNR
jgi:aminobenzoyl-glutamate utilization protein B